MATIKDVCKETGLSLATISKYINGGTVREKNRVVIEEAIDRLGFTVNEFARGLKTKRSKSIGVVIPDLSNIFITTIITCAEDILRKKGYSILVSDCHGDVQQEEEAIRFLIHKRVDGIINMPISHEGTHLDIAVEQKIPIVLIDRIINRMQDKVNAVLVDNISGASNAVSALLDAGHKNVGVILGPEEIFTSGQRKVGYAQAMIQHGLFPNDNHVIYSDYTVHGGYASMMTLLKNKEITAVFVSNYEMTLGAMIAINDLGVRIPSEISFIGFDNEQLSMVMRPRLTIVTQPLAQIGETAAQILLDQLETAENQRKSKVVTLPTDMLLGESVAQIVR